MMVLAASDMRGAKVNKTKEKHAVCECIEHMSCLQRNEGEHVCGRMPVSIVQSWRLKKEGGVPGEGEGESLTVGNAQKM